MMADTMAAAVTLSPEQEAVVAHRGADLQVMAAAGSGTTESTSRRVPRYGNYDVLDENRHARFLSREYYRIGLSTRKAKHWASIRDSTRLLDVIGNELISDLRLATKSTNTVGFMGVGFKSVFEAHETVRVSSGDWRFQLSVPSDETFGGRLWIGAVLPTWAPDAGMPGDSCTCRFQFVRRLIGD